MSAVSDEFAQADYDAVGFATILANAVANGEPSCEVEHWAERYRVARDRKHAAALAYFGKCHACGAVVDLTDATAERDHRP